MPTNDDVDEAMTDIAHMATTAGISTRPAEVPSTTRQEILLLRILATEPLRTKRSPQRRGLRILAATSAVAASLAFGLALVSQQGGSGPERRAVPVATQKPSNHPAVGPENILGSPLTVPKTPEQWLAAQAGRDAIIARRTSAFVYDPAQSKEWDQPMGTAQMIVVTSLSGKLHARDTFTVESALTRRGTDWDSAVLEQGQPYLLFPDSYGPATFIVNDDIYSLLDADHYELVDSTGSNVSVQPQTISIRSFRSLLASQ